MASSGIKEEWEKIEARDWKSLHRKVTEKAKELVPLRHKGHNEALETRKKACQKYNSRRPRRT